MGNPTIGSIVLVKFPQTDLKSYKMRPAFVMAATEFEELILCQITSNPFTGKFAITLKQSCLETGAMPIDSYIHPDKIFTADRQIITEIIATSDSTVVDQVKNRLWKLLAL